ncbi:MAG: putative ABC transporter permease [Porcipelethomonas sp.]
MGIMKNLQKVQKHFICFVWYSVLGWCYEVVLETFIYRWGFSNRGVLFGPYCPVYGFGALAFILSLGWLMNKKDKLWLNIIKPVIIFTGCMIIATAIELAASYILEYATGSWPWQTYESYKYNFQARIALSTSVRFGIGGTVFLYIVQPFFEWLISKMNTKVKNIISVFMLSVLLIDCIFTFFVSRYI